MGFTREWYDAYLNKRGVSNAKQRERKEALAGSGSGEAPRTGCIPVCFTLYRVRLLDVDAKFHSIKDLLDCLVAAGFLAGDKEGQVNLTVKQEKVRRYAEERTEIEIIYDED